MNDETQSTAELIVLSDCCETVFDITACLLKNVKPKQGHWINGGEYDQSENWCFECGSKKVAKLNKRLKHEKYMLDGGWENHESDYPAFCEKCGCLLNYWPTEDCAEDEIEHFEAIEKITNEMSEEDLYSLTVLCQAAQDFDSEELRMRLAKICMKFLQWYRFHGTKKQEGN